MIDSRKYYLFLDGFRGIAVLGVIFGHIFGFFDLHAILGALFVPFSKLAAVGTFGVDMFFVISGFLITGLLLDDLENGKIRIKRFYFRRFLKIIPQYTLTVIAGLILMLVYHIQGFGQAENYNPFHNIWINFVFLQNYYDSIQLPTLAHLWTIAVEEQFYFIYPLILISISLLLKGSYQRRVVLTAICIILLIIGNLCRYDEISAIFRLKGGTFAFQKTHFHFDGLVFGILIKLIEPYLYRINGTLKKLFSFACFIGALAIYLMFIVNGVNVFFWPTFGLAYLAPGLLIISALIDESSFIKYFEENQALRWVGRSSYGIYLWHYILLFFFLANCKQPILLNVIITYVITTILIGFLSTVTVERYFLSFRSILDT